MKFIPGVDDEVLARFLVEARAAARSQHPNLATLYRVGQLENRPYLISEFVPGTGLERLDRPVAPDRVLAIALDVARGLAAAHRRGVLHRDIKPGNVILAETGEAKLLDFGLAKLVRPVATAAPDGDPEPGPGPGLGPGGGGLSADEEDELENLTHDELVGTPHFMAPEAWRREDLTARADIYSLGAVLFELCAGRGPFRDVPVAELPRAVQTRDPAPVASMAPAVPDGLARVIDRCVRRRPEERPSSADELVAALETLRPTRALAQVPGGNPYRGLRPFGPEHQALFFGRQRALAHALERLRTDPLVLVTGDSGVGKSSLCAAGLVPLVAEGALADGRTWAIVRLTPGQTPLHTLAGTLAPVLGSESGELEARVREDPAALGRLARRALPESQGLLVHVDQLEELVTLATPGAAPFAEAIGALAAGTPGLRVVATARTDFLSRLEALPGLRERGSRGLFLLAPLGRDEVREAIVGPAAVKETRFESDELVDELVDSTMSADGALPLLQFALAELWDQRDREAGLIRRDELAAIGGVAGALSRHADRLLARLQGAERAVARSLLLRLVTQEGTRARRLETELVPLSPRADRVIEVLVQGRILVASETPDGTAYEIAHEALVDSWGTLAGWLAEEAETRALVRRIDTAAAEWQRRGRPRELLWTDRRIAEVAGVPPSELTARERLFVDASRRARRRTQWSRRGAVLAPIVVAAGVWGAVHIGAARERDDDIAGALRHASVVLEDARELDDRWQEVRARAFDAFDAGQTERGEQVWERAQALETRVFSRYVEASEPIERALLLDPGRDEVRRRYAEILYERAAIAEREDHPEVRELLRRMRLYDDGDRLLARWREPARLEVSSRPPGAQITVYRYRDENGRRIREEVRSGRTPTRDLEVAPGSILLELRLEGRAVTRYPLVAGRGERVEVTVPLAAAADVPDGFVWIPPGDAPFGSSDAEPVRSFFNAVPMHRVRTGGYVIARHETTFADWIAFLDALRPEERATRTPRIGTSGLKGKLALQRRDGRWELSFQPGSTPLRATAGEPIRYPDREADAVQDWLEFPVVGISRGDAEAYTRWLDRTGRVPGARLCGEAEWERAARGADERRFPHGDVLGDQDANFDETYGKEPDAFGPNEVGSHPASRSPFGVHDLAGNAWEWVASQAPGSQAVARGGSYDYAATTARIANREPVKAGYRDASLGSRVCASRDAP